MFIIDGKEFTWADIECAARLWNEWDALEAETAEGLAVSAWATANEKKADPVAVRNAANGFRYSRNLISAEEAREWLATWEITLAEWTGYFRRLKLREVFTGKKATLMADFCPTAAQIAGAIRCEALCSGRLEKWARRLAGQAAITAKCYGNLDSVDAINERFQSCRDSFLTDARRLDSIASHFLDWMHFDCEYIWFAEERLAREAALCVTEDGYSLEDVAGDARSVVQQWGFFLDEIEPRVRGEFLAARPGDWLGPLNFLEGFPLFRIVHKQMPLDADPEVRRRADLNILETVMSHEVANRVRWIARF